MAQEASLRITMVMEAASTTSDPGLSLKDDCSKYYYNNTLRRFMPISGSCIQSTNYSTSYNASNQLLNWVEVMERMLTLAEKTKRTFHYPPYHSPFNCPPPTGDYITRGPTPQEQRYMHTLRSCQATANNGYSHIYKSIPYEEVDKDFVWMLAPNVWTLILYPSIKKRESVLKN